MMPAWSFALGMALAHPVAEVDATGLEMRWRALRSDRFVVHFAEHPRTGESWKGAAERVLAEAERAWPLVCDALDYFPFERIHIVLTPGDVPVGHTWPTRDLVVLSARPSAMLDRARGPSDPLRMVLRHELAHVVHHKSVRRLAGRVRGVGFHVALWDGDLNLSMNGTGMLEAPMPAWFSDS